MPSSLKPGDHLVMNSHFDTEFNAELFAQYLDACDREDVKKTHHFKGRYENIYLNEQHAPLLQPLRSELSEQAEKILGRPVNRMGCWFNAMGPGAETTLHSHDEDDEVLSAVYYVRVPEQSGELIIHGHPNPVHHQPREGHWVFFSPRTPHEVSKNQSNQLRLSIAFNIC